MAQIEKTKVIIADDIKMDRDYIGNILSKEPKIEIVCSVSTGAKLLEYLQDGNNPKPDIVLLDMSLQGGSTEGVEIAKKIKEMPGKMEIIIISGNFDYPSPYETDQDKTTKLRKNYNAIASAIKAGAKGFISKNVDYNLNEDINRAIRCIVRGEDYFFNAPVLHTVVTAFLQQAELPPASNANSNPHEKAKALGLDSGIDLKHLQLMAEGKTAGEISQQLMEDADGNCRKEYSEKGINARQQAIAKKLNVMNNSNLIVMKAIQEGLIDPFAIKLPVKYYSGAK